MLAYCEVVGRGVNHKPWLLGKRHVYGRRLGDQAAIGELTAVNIATDNTTKLITRETTMSRPFSNGRVAAE